jgi:flavin reductase (DIM6/NTAB) family NADH-FMN oxidoreductase RutF
MSEQAQGQPESVHPDRFRTVLGTVPAPVSVVTSIDGGRPHGTTVSAFCSLSLHPPMVLVALARDSDLLALIKRTGRYGINVLARGQESFAEHFARKGPDKFAAVEWHEDSGLPRLPGTQAWLACEVGDLLPAGDHVIATGHVTDVDHRDAEPLVYKERTFWALAEPLA